MLIPTLPSSLRARYNRNLKRKKIMREFWLKMTFYVFLTISVLSACVVAVRNEEALKFCEATVVAQYGEFDVALVNSYQIPSGPVGRIWEQSYAVSVEGTVITTVHMFCGRNLHQHAVSGSRTDLVLMLLDE